jgi:hypothetical protein
LQGLYEDFSSDDGDDIADHLNKIKVAFKKERMRSKGRRPFPMEPNTACFGKKKNKLVIDTSVVNSELDASTLYQNLLSNRTKSIKSPTDSVAASIKKKLSLLSFDEPTLKKAIRLVSPAYKRGASHFELNGQGSGVNRSALITTRKKVSGPIAKPALYSY